MNKNNISDIIFTAAVAVVAVVFAISIPVRLAMFSYDLIDRRLERLEAYHMDDTPEITEQPEGNEHD